MQYDIKGHKVDFPHKAYGVQLAFISKVIKTLDCKENALLEAPTGKTVQRHLCLHFLSCRAPT